MNALAGFAAIDWESSVPFIVGTVGAAAIIAIVGLLWRVGGVMFRIADQVETIAPHFRPQTPTEVALGAVDESLPARVARLEPSVHQQAGDLRSHLITETADARVLNERLERGDARMGRIEDTVNGAVQRLDDVIAGMEKAADDRKDLDLGQTQIAHTLQTVREAQ